MKFQTFISVLRDLGAIQPNMKLLDFGCGDGQLVQAALDQCFDAYGCEFINEAFTRDESLLHKMVAAKRVLPIQKSPYRLPFGDGTFDIVISSHVFEHVRNYNTALAELRRVVKPNGVGLHVFPARWCPIEGHVYVPFSGVFRPRWWLGLWALLGIRNKYQQSLSARETLEANLKFLSEHTNYLPSREIERLFLLHFRDLRHVEGTFLTHSRRAKYCPPSLYRRFRAQCIYTIA
jgi:SAM-dependent methyltransferase